jgi:hypothetical protein
MRGRVLSEGSSCGNDAAARLLSALGNGQSRQQRPGV